MAELGDRVEHSMALTGLSAEKVSTMGGVAKVTGGDFDELTRAMERMALNVTKAAKDSFGPAAQGLKALGLSAKELSGLPTDQYFERLAEAVSKYNPSLNRTVAFEAIAGRGTAALLPILSRGAEAYRELAAEVEKTGAVLSGGQVAAMAKTHEMLELLSLSVQGFGVKLFTVLEPAIDAVIHKFSEWTQSVKMDTIRDAVNSIGNTMINIAENVAMFFVNTKRTWDEFILTLQQSLPAVHAAAAGVLFLAFQFKAAEEEFRRFKEGSTTDTMEAIAKRAADATEGIRNFAQAAREGFNAMVPKSDSFDAQLQSALQLSRAVNEAAESYVKLNAGTMNMGGKEEMAVALAAVQERIKLADMEYSEIAERISSQVKIFAITEQQKTQQLLAALDVRRAAEMGAISAELAIAQKGTTEYQRVLNEKLTLEQKYQADRRKIQDQQLQSDFAEWQSELSAIQSAWDSQMRGLLAGTTSWGQAVKNIFADLTLKAIQSFEKMAVDWASMELAKTGATSAGVAARNAVESAGAAVSSLAQIGNAAGVIIADAAKTFAGIFGFLAPTMGPAAAGPAAAGGATVLGALGAIPAAAHRRLCSGNGAGNGAPG
jgi:hypothetical protein